MKAVTILLLSIVLTATAVATPYTVANGNASITVDPTSVFGLEDYSLNGVPQLFEQWYWFRLSGASFESPLNSLSVTSASAVGNQILVSLAGPSLGVDLSYTLVGGAPGSIFASLHETATLINLTSSPLALAWFMEADFDLGGSGGNDFITGGLSGLLQTDGTYEVLTTPGVTPDAFQVAPFPDLFLSLNDFSITNLDDSGSPFGPGDGTFAYQWNVLLPPDTRRTLPLDKDFVPEPSTFALLAPGLGLIALRLRRGLSGRF